MDFLAFLVPKLWPNFRKINYSRGIPTNPLGNSYKIWGLLAIIVAPETLESPSRALKTRIIAQNTNKL